MKTLATFLFAALVACGGSPKTGPTTPPTATAGSGDEAGGGMTGTTTPPSGPDSAGGAAGSNSMAAGGPVAPLPPDPAMSVPLPNADPDPVQAKAQVDRLLEVARQALEAPTPDPDRALREARDALTIDASNIDAAAMVAFAYYHQKKYDTAELVLDDVFKRPPAKENANVFYVYGLVYDHTNRPEQAVLAFQSAVKINPNFASALVDLGEHQLENKQYTEAQATFEKLTKQLGRADAVTLTSLGSAYRGHSVDYPVGSADRNTLITTAEATYRRALAVNPNYGPAAYNLALLYLDADPFPSGGGSLDTMARLNAAKGFLDQYKNMPGVDIKLYAERMKDVDKALKRASKRAKASAKAAGKS